MNLLKVRRAALKFRRYYNSDTIKHIEDDGYGKKNSLWSRFANIFQETTPGTLILVRHGESEWNHKKLFTGWVDVDLSERGKREVEHAARLLLERGYTVDIAYTSMLKRAIRSSWIILNELNQVYRPLIKSWRLNERMYGDLEGYSKPGLAKKYGNELVQKWRGGIDRPPEMKSNHIYWHRHEDKYKSLNPQDIPLTESLEDTLDRTLPLWNDEILPDLRNGRNVMIVAHRNSIRGILKHIDSIPTENLQKVRIPNGIPLVYKFHPNMKPIPHKRAVAPLSGVWLEKQGLLRAALEREEEMANAIAGYHPSLNITDRFELMPGQHSPMLTSMSSNTPSPGVTSSVDIGPVFTVGSDSNTNLSRLRALHKLQEEKEMLRKVDDVTQNFISREKTLGEEQIEHSTSIYYDPSVMKGYSNPFINIINASAKKPGDDIEQQQSSRNINNDATSNSNSSDNHSINKANAYIDMTTNTENTTNQPPVIDDTANDAVLKKPLLVIIRHGKTEHNKLGLFTGWEDALLAKEGREEAQAAGKLLNKFNLKFDVVYTSWLSRAIETADIILDVCDLMWLPVVKSWRLNERMYGALTGLSKKMIRQIYGEEQYKQWRRGFDTPPPTISSFSHAYPGNDSRYVNYVSDLEISWFETAIRSLAHGKIEFHRKFPKSESLKDCMERTIPYFLNTISPDSIRPGKNVLIASSENAIRGLLMLLCGIPPWKIHNVEIPTGLPLVYDSAYGGRIRLLDDGEARSLLERYDFGSYPDLLFKGRKAQVIPNIDNSSNSTIPPVQQQGKDGKDDGHASSSKDKKRPCSVDYEDIIIRLPKELDPNQGKRNKEDDDDY